MSKITLEPNSSGAGTFSIVSPDSNTNRTLNLPDESGTVATIENIPPGYEDQDALDLFNATGSAPVFACRAWVNFDGTGTVAIRENGNVSSITDNGTGDYTVNFSTSMPDNKYATMIGGTFRGDNSANVSVGNIANNSPGDPATPRQHNTSGVRIFIKRSVDSSANDSPWLAVAVFR